MLLYGRNPVLEALAQGQVQELLVARGVERGFLRELEAHDVRPRMVPRIELDQLVGTTAHQGVVAEVAEVRYAEVEDMFALARKRGEDPLIVVLDGITDPRNFGAIIRSAEVLGAHGVVTEERRSAPLSATVAKTSAGATAHLPVAQVKNLARFLAEIKEQGVWVYGAAGEARAGVAQLDYRRPLAVVIGSEGSGLRRLVREHCDELLHIPQRGQVQSLNASVAASIILYEAVRARG